MLVILQTAFYGRRVSVVPLNVNGFKLFMQLKKNLMWEIFSIWFKSWLWSGQTHWLSLWVCMSIVMLKK